MGDVGAFVFEVRGRGDDERDVMGKRGPLPVDAQVGQNIRIYRLKRGMSQDEVGRKLGVTFQQVQKYEKGRNRVGAGRLAQIADILGVSIPALFERTETASGEPSNVGRLLAEPRALRLLQSFDGIDNADVRLAVLRLVESLAQSPRESAAPKKRR